MRKFYSDTLIRLGFVIIMAMILLVPVYAQAPTKSPQWEVVSVVDQTQASPNAATPEIDVQVNDDGAILITTDRATNIKVFSILGQLITQRNVSAGTVRLRMEARGIYILKAGTTTRRISL